MRPYEILFIIKTDREEEEFDAVIEKFTALIEREGQVSKVDKWVSASLLMKSIRNTVMVSTL